MKFAKRAEGMKPSAIREILKAMSDPTLISLAGGNPDPESFPVKEMAEISQDLFLNNAAKALQYGITEGYTPLREQMKERLEKKFNINKEAGELIITTGGQQGLDLTCRVLCNEGDIVVCENPSFLGALNSFRSFGAELLGVPVDDDGMNMEELENVLKNTKNVKMIYTIPTFQNPMGVTMSLEKRKKMLALAEKYDVIILEDNPYGELRFKGDDIPTIKSLDTKGQVVYCSSFSKIFSPGIRVGYLCGKPEIIAKAVVAKQVSDVHTNLFFQMLISEFIEKYDLDGHINKIRGIYREKAAAMQTAIKKYLPENVKCTDPDGGLFLWCTLPDGRDSVEFAAELMKKKVAVIPGNAFYVDTEKPCDGLRLNYSMPSFENIDKAIKAMGECING